MSPALRRRDFLAGLLAGVLGAPLLACARAADLPAFRSGLFKDRDLDKGPIADFTRIHLARHPEEADPEVLVRRLFGRAPGEDADALKRTLREEIRKDFAEGRTENLDGWTLALTEIRLWCLYLAVTP